MTTAEGNSHRTRAALWPIMALAVLTAAGFGRQNGAIDQRRAHKDGRGRHADSPAEIPVRGWKDIVLRVYAGISDDRILANAAGVTFYGLLALFPGIAALVSIYGLFADPQEIAKNLDMVTDVLPSGALDVIRDQLTRVTQQGRATLGASFIVSLLISLWSANGGVKAMFDAMNVVYEERETRNLIRLNAASLLFTLGAIFFLLLALAAVVAVPVVLQFLAMREVMAAVLTLARWPILLVVIAFGLALLYRFGPDRREPQWKWVTPGSVFAAFAWLAASALFSWYAANFGSFNKTYGSLGAVIGFMMWMWLSTIVILVGAKMNAEIEHQTARDSTEGHPKPLGARDARMADTVGAAMD